MITLACFIRVESKLIIKITPNYNLKLTKILPKVLKVIKTMIMVNLKNMTKKWHFPGVFSPPLSNLMASFVDPHELLYNVRFSCHNYYLSKNPKISAEHLDTNN